MLGVPPTPPAGGCSAPAQLVVEHGNARFTVLSASIIRLERAPFIDACSFTFINRSPQERPGYTHEVDSSGTLRINTSKIALQYKPTTNATGVCGRSDTHASTNPTNPVRSHKFPQGLKNKTPQECCTACKSDPSCTAYVYGPGGKEGRDCWPLRGYTSTQADSNRTLVVMNTNPGSFHPNELSITVMPDVSGLSYLTKQL